MGKGIEGEDMGMAWARMRAPVFTSQKMPKPDKALVLLILSTNHPKC
jgi:hypothetical protein